MTLPRTRGLAAGLALAALACAVALSAGPAGGTGYSFRNSAPVPEEDEASFRLSLACISTPGQSTGSLSYVTALAQARALVKVGTARYKKLDNLKAIDTPVKAQGAAAMAILKGSPKGPLAALIAALEETPGKPREALAFIERAAKRPAPRTGTGIPWPAVLDAPVGPGF